MTKLITLFLVLSLALISVNCKKSEEPSAIPEKYIGTWEANVDLTESLIQYAMVDEPYTTIPVTALASVKAVLNRNGTYSTTFTAPGEAPEVDTGTATIDEDDKTITMNSVGGEPIIFAYEWEDDILVLTTLTEFDFTFQGNEPVDAVVTLKLVKTS
jgi:hypothetical protein